MLWTYLIERNVEFEVRNEKIYVIQNWGSFSICYLDDPAITISASRLILRYVLLNEQTLNSVFGIINYIIQASVPIFGIKLLLHT